MIDQIQHHIAQGEFPLCVRSLEDINVLHQICVTEKPWALQIMENFHKRMITPQLLRKIELSWPQLNFMDADKLEALRHILLLLPTDMFFNLCPVITNIHLPILDNLITEVLGIHCKRNIENLEQLLSTADELVIISIIDVLQNMKEIDFTNILFKLTSHSSDQICRNSINALINLDHQNLKILFPLIEDSRPHVRRHILDHFGKKKDKLAEELLLGYLQKQPMWPKKSQHILACYRVLGQCASSKSVPFLQSSLLTQNWKALLGIDDSIHREGAALALMRMTHEEAAQACLRKASKSLYHGVRSSYRRAFKEYQKVNKGLVN
jgi:hypothetical protein